MHSSNHAPVEPATYELLLQRICKHDYFRPRTNRRLPLDRGSRCFRVDLLYICMVSLVLPGWSRRVEAVEPT